MSTKHTPGPWEFWSGRINQDSANRVYVGDTNPRQRGLICELLRLGPIDSELEQANAQLIAAAPELLRLLAQAVDYLDPTTAGGWMLEAKALLEELPR